MNWEVGDLALRVKPVNPERGPVVGLRQGGVYTVTAVLTDGFGNTGLRFDGVRNNLAKSRLKAFDARGFIKITPGTDVEGYEERRRELCN